MPATWQEGATSPPIRFVLTQDGAAFPLTDKTLKLRFGPKGGPALWEREVFIDSPEAAGLAHLDWQEGDLAVSAKYEGQLILVNADLSEEPLAVFEIVVTRSIPEPPAP